MCNFCITGGNATYTATKSDTTHKQRDDGYIHWQRSFGRCNCRANVIPWQFRATAHASYCTMAAVLLRSLGPLSTAPSPPAASASACRCGRAVVCRNLTLCCGQTTDSEKLITCCNNNSKSCTHMTCGKTFLWDAQTCQMSGCWNKCAHLRLCGLVLLWSSKAPAVWK